MALNLDSGQMMDLFEVLEIPYAGASGEVFELTPIGDAAATGVSWDSVAMQKAWTLVYNWVSGMSDSGQDRLTGLLSSWRALGNDMSSIDAGNVGDISSFNYSAESTRDRIEKRVRTIVPFWRHHTEIQRAPAGAIVFST